MANRFFHIILILIAVLYLSPSSAQVGFKAGVGISDIVFMKDGQTPYLGYEVDYFTHRLPKLSYHFGAFTAFSIGKKIEFQPELLFVFAGLDYSMNFDYGKTIYRLNINYFQVPLLFKFKTKPEKTKHFTILAGPYASVKLSATKIMEIDGNREEKKMMNVRNGDFGIAAGIAMEFDMSKGILVIDFRMTYSLINMMNHLEGYVPKYNAPDIDRAKNVNLALTVGYRFINLWSDKTG